MSRLPADGCRALDVGPGGGHVVVPAQLRQQVLDEVDEDQVTAGHHQVAQSHDGPLKEAGGEGTQRGLLGVKGQRSKVTRTFLTASLGEVS